MDDLISRQELLRIIDLRIANKKDARKQMHSSLFVDGMEDGYLRIRSDVCQMPSAERKGKWINNSPVTMKCDRCGYVIRDWRWNELNFCANCGADMIGEEDG